MAVREKSLRGQVFDKIRSDILKGRYQQGDELVECTIGKELGVSRTPVREAIRQLELEGLVRLVPNKGAFVNGISARDVTDIYLIRSRLEGLCARMAVENITPEQLEAMEEAIVLSDYHAKKNIMSRSVRWTANSTSFYMKPPAAGCFPTHCLISISMYSVCGRYPS